MRSELYWEIPSSVDLEGFLRKHKPDFRYKIDHFYYIIDYLCRGMEMEDMDDIGGFISLNARRLQAVMHNYKLYLDHLVKHRFIRTDMKYIPGKKSRGYRLNNNRYYEATVKKVPVTDFVMRRKLSKEIREDESIKTTTQQSYPFLTKWFNHLLEIDAEKAIRKVEEIYPKQTGPIRGTKRGKASDWEKRYKAVRALNKLANHEFYYKVDDSVGRFHSNLTNLKKEIRNYITYNKQKLVNVDIKNSQPLFSTLLFTKGFYDSNSKLINLYNLPNIHNLLNNNTHPSLTIMIVKTLENKDNQDINTYINLVNSGTFYQQISSLMYPTRPFNKKKAKDMIFIIFFSENNRFMRNKEGPKRIFKGLFPKTYKVFRLIKSSDHTALARILQRIESVIIIQHVVPRIASERPELPIFTIHDSVVTTLGNEDYIESIIREEIKKLTGLDAKIGKEYWEP